MQTSGTWMERASPGDGQHGLYCAEQMAIDSFHVLAKPIGPQCNLNCEYCFYLEKEHLYPRNADWRMPEEVLRSFIRQNIEGQDSPVIHFAWQGGEPTLLGVDFFRKVVRIQQEFAGGKRIENAFQTNGVLLDEEWGEFLAAKRFLVGLSIDGPPELHNRYRVDKGHRPTFSRVIGGLKHLQMNNVEFNTLTVVQKQNSRHPLEVYDFLKEIGSRFMQFIPIVERVGERSTPEGLVLLSPDSESSAAVSKWSVEADDYGEFLCRIFDEWVRNDVGKYYVQLFDVALEAWTGREPSLCVFRETCGRALAIEHNGDLYSCDHYVYPENRLGNILDKSLETLIDSPQQRAFGEAKRDALPEYCRRCSVRFLCNGECPKRRFIQSPSGEPGLNYLCSGYKRFFHHVGPFMDFMARELAHRRSPANVTMWIRVRDAHQRGKLGRNDPCPCGSGVKIKLASPGRFCFPSAAHFFMRAIF